MDLIKSKLNHSKIVNSKENNSNGLEAATRNDIDTILDQLLRGEIDKGRVTALAFQLENLEMLETLIEADYMDVNFKEIRYGKTALHLAAELAHVPAINFLLDHGADVNSRDNYFDTPLRYALMNRRNVCLKEVTGILLSRGADVNARNARGNTPLYHAVVRNYVGFVKCLLKNGSDVDVRDHQNRTVLYTAITQYGRSPNLKLVEMLLRCGIDLDVDIPKYGDILNYSMKNFNNNVWKIIVQHVAILSTVEDWPVTPVITDTIKKTVILRDYFGKCQKELLVAQKTKLRHCWVTFYNLLTDNERKLRNYAGNEDLIKDFEETNLEEKFPIYGEKLLNIVAQGIKIRKSWDHAVDILNNRWPIFGPTHLIIRDVLDCLTEGDVLKFCQ